MANYYTKLSFSIELPPEAIRWALDLYERIGEVDGEGAVDELVSEGRIPDDEFTAIVRALNAVDYSFRVARESDGIWISHDENACPDVVAQFVQAILTKFDLTQTVTFEWAHTCSRPEVNAFGGGAARVTKGHIEMMTTAMWVSEAADAR